MNILALEDRGSVSHYMTEALQSKQHEVLLAFDVPDAQSIWEEENVDCIIADLNLNPKGLSPAQIEESQRGLLTGWIWLRDRVFNAKPEMRERTIIYSEYVKDLEAAVTSDELAGIVCINKRGATSPAAQVLRQVQAIAEKCEALHD